jgi:hypothetical protein
LPTLSIILKVFLPFHLWLKAEEDVYCVKDYYYSNWCLFRTFVVVALLLVVECAVVAGVEVVEVGGHLGLQLVLHQEGLHATVKETRPEAVIPK